MFGDKDNDQHRPKNRLGIISEVTKMIGGANDIQLMQFAKRPIIDWVEWLRNRPHFEEPGQLPIDIIAHTKDPEGNPRTEIIAAKLNPDGSIIMNSRAELNSQLTRFISDGGKR